MNDTTALHSERSTGSNNGHLESQPNFDTINNACQTVSNGYQEINNELQKLQHLPAVQISFELLAEIRSIKARLTSIETSLETRMTSMNDNIHNVQVQNRATCVLLHFPLFFFY